MCVASGREPGRSVPEIDGFKMYGVDEDVDEDVSAVAVVVAAEAAAAAADDVGCEREPDASNTIGWVVAACPARPSTKYGILRGRSDHCRCHRSIIAGGGKPSTSTKFPI